METGLARKTGIVTGAGSGIGAAIASRLIAEGANVVVADINFEAAEAQVEALRSEGGNALAVRANVVYEAEVVAMVEQTVSTFGAVHILVNNAGLTRDMRITKMTDADWDIVVDVILKGSFHCTKAVLPYMNEQKWGRIINISSRAHLGNPGQANYSAAKAGLIGFTRAMSLEAGRNFVTVNAVAPGIINTEMIRSLPHWDKIRENAEKTTPIPRVGEAEDVADAVAFLASERASYISGDVLHVTGGRY
ncbi:3-oxoacyl-ACP reductase FabG [Rhizobium leguminosarum]|uniref:3-oxoacyl-ACP reductase FabG n=2 Tax=Rhizobium TaxID=379 RepID=UPI001C97BC8C|nr:3-oxoacyl-ACP reductase FabG [Rhizobium leguminosarum]MBY5392848.1 3-oxoacyl-ACP reductase FabG [Rhizobium leguminosarum]MBY5434484.1 3-oxoacyl-ACP reductase FabG [Rhizobium leguminosarum]